VLSGQDVDVDVFGVLVRRQHSHADGEALLVQAELESDLLNAGEQVALNPGVTQAEI
jgi:hypothetical protein